MKKIIFLTSLGSGLEYYDFTIYALLAKFIQPAFFPSADRFTGLIWTFTLFAVGYLARPLGGVILSSMGDYFGRQKLFIYSLLLMALATLMIGLTPVFSSYPLISAGLLLLWRILQGISYGAELPISLTFLLEHSQVTQHGKNTGWMVSSITIGVVIATLVSFILSYCLSNASMISWGWRIPFLLGGGIGIILYFLRQQTEESPVFQQLQTVVHNNYKNLSITQLFTDYRRPLLVGLGIMLLPAHLVILFLTLPGYWGQFAKQLTTTQIYAATTTGHLLAILLPLIFGRLADYFGQKTQFLFTTYAFLLLSWPLFLLLTQASFSGALIFAILLELLICAMASCYFTMLVASFPPAIRCTGIAACYNIAYMLAAQLPTLINYNLKQTGNLYLVASLLLLLAGINIYSLCRYQTSEQAVISGN